MNRSAFFNHLRHSGVFATSLTGGQVNGCEALLDAGEGYDLPHLAHVLAEVYHETGGGMLPVKETVFAHSKDKNPTDKTVIGRLNRAFSRGKLTWVKTPYWRGGWFGRGQIQITHESNYRKASALVGVDLVANPNRALDLDISAQIACQGCRSGMFTGKRLSDFDGPEYDHHNARAIVNGDKRAMGPTMVKYGKAFEAALHAGGYQAIPDAPRADWAPDASAAPDPAEAAQGPWAALMAALLSIFGGKK